ncbi:ATP-dependent helicase [Vibrio sp. 1159]|uniref:ATP-dependent helicase n=1 Tax=Vibrio sp. 1159 TaxID=3074545 RepID=UPI0029644785|nr:ATP-dependent helicase [Vibrio sp. 1159]MDW2323228.1 ATP-dependent helicase [Vibrio sp. 1159]
MSGLTEDQQLVADSDGHTMCCALPGSGKSHTMVALADNLVNKDPSYKLLLITFTKAAAEELNERLAQKIQGNGKYRAKAATFDSVFGQQVRNGGRSTKRTLVGGEQYNFLERAMRHAGLSMEIDEAMNAIDTYGRMLKPEPIGGKSSNSGWLIYQAYSDLLKKNNCQDFNLIARSAYLGVQNGTLPPWDATHILVDEFQDTSDMQYAWIQIHGEMGAKIVVVGDDDQSIYSWRGAAGYQNMVNFQGDFNAIGYVLKKCFRCRPEILAAAKRVIEYNEDRVYKDMVSGREEGGIVNLKGYLTAADEFQGMIEAITSDNRQWAVLGRTNRILDEAEGYLKLHDIPYRRLGGKKLWDDNVANIVLKLLWSLVRPKDTRFISEILGWLGEDEEAIQMVTQGLAKKRCSFGDFMPPAWLDWQHSSEQLHLHWKDWGTDTNTKSDLNVRVKVIVDFLKTHRGGKGREARLIELVGDILNNLNVEGGFVDRVELLSKNLAPSPKGVDEDTERGVVTLSSLHSSKGLQWEQVWICGSNQGVCPSNNSLEEDSTGGVPEERRLFYVGMTRAVDELYLSFNSDPDSSGTAKKKEPSQFLVEGFPEELAQVEEKLELLAKQRKDEEQEAA